MANEFYATSGSPATSSQGSSATMRSEFTAIAAGFDKLPTLAGNGSKLVQINSGGTAMTAVALTVGAILFGGAAGVLGQDGGNLFWDNTAKRLGIGNAAPSVALDVTGAIKTSTTLTATTSVVTPLVQASAGLVVNANVGDINFQTAGTRRWNILNSTSALQPDQDNVWNFGSAAARIASGFFGTSVVTPMIGTATATVVSLMYNNASVVDFTSGNFNPNVDNATNLGVNTKRWSQVVTPILTSGTTGSILLKTYDADTTPRTQAAIAHTAGADQFVTLKGGNGAAPQVVGSTGGLILDSGSTGSMVLKTNNGQIGLELLNQTSAVNYMQVRPEASGIDPSFIGNGSDPNVGFRWITKGTGGYAFHTNGSGTNTQFQVLHTASASRNITVTGSNGGNPTLGVTAGSLAITPSVVLASSLTFSAAAAKIIPGATSFALRNTADSADNLLLADAGDATFRTKITMPGPLVFTAAASKIIPGATSLSLRNTADSADNLLVTDAGALTGRTTITATTGMAVGGATAGAGGVAFPATAVSVVDVNTLDDYEEGTWTPGITFNGASVGITYSTQSGSYTKIGRLVVAMFVVTLSNKGSSTGAALITGLPFTANGSIPGPASALNWGTLATNWVNFLGTASTSGTTIILSGANAAATSNATIPVNTDFTNSTSIQGTISYYV